MNKYITLPCPSVLIYHKLSFYYDKNKYVFLASEFRKHLDAIKSLRMNPLTVDQVHESTKDNESGYNKNILLTFDDGNISDFNISFPILSIYNFVATFFITTDWIGTDGYMSSSQILKLSQSGMSVQSHAKSHNFLDEMTENKLHEELKDSKQILEGIIGKPVTSLSIPGGRLNERVIACAGSLGYRYIYTSVPFQCDQVQDVKIIGRIGLRQPMIIDEFKRYLKATPMTIIKLKSKQFIKTKLKLMLGGRLYYVLWKIIIK